MIDIVEEDSKMSKGENSKISIIVPVYNVEKYLIRCVESILNQSYKEFELILIDDGSCDRSGEICDELAQTDNRIRVFHKCNGGAASARNYGLELVNGEYLAYIDSDDYIERDYLEQLVQGIQGFDLVISGYYVEDTEGRVIKEFQCNEKKVFGNVEIKKACIDRVIGDMNSPVCKLYRTSIAMKIRFDENMIIGEDSVFNAEYLEKVEAISCIRYSGYRYQMNLTSVTHVTGSKYTQWYEHDDVRYKKKFLVRIMWGVEPEIERKKMLETYPCRYYLEVRNLFAENSPYGKKEIIEKIDEIHKDRVFINVIRKSCFFSQPKAGKIAWLCCKIANKYFTYYTILSLKKLHK